MKKLFLSLAFISIIPVFAQAKKGEVLRFTAELHESRITLTWSTTPHSEMVLLYRSDSPFVDYASLASSVLLSTFSPQTTSYVDTPPANTNYYYALLFESDILSGLSLQFNSGKNTTASPVRVLADIDELSPPERSLSLPLLSGTESNSFTVTEFSNETEKKIKALETKFQKYHSYLLDLELKSSHTEISFFRFPEETAGTESISSLTLKRLLDNFINNKNWYNLEIELKQFLKLNHPELITMRATFYLAQAFFFQHQYDNALLLFLVTEDHYKEQASLWIKRTVERLSQVNY